MFPGRPCQRFGLMSKIRGHFTSLVAKLLLTWLIFILECMHHETITLKGSPLWAVLPLSPPQHPLWTGTYVNATCSRFAKVAAWTTSSHVFKGVSLLWMRGWPPSAVFGFIIEDGVANCCYNITSRQVIPVHMHLTTGNAIRAEIMLLVWRTLQLPATLLLSR